MNEMRTDNRVVKTMKKLGSARLVVFGIACFFACLRSAEAEPSLSFSGEVYYRMLNIVNTGGLHTRAIVTGDEREWNKAWFHTVSGLAVGSFAASPKLDFLVGFRGNIESASASGTFNSGISECRMRLRTGNPDKPIFDLRAGVFHFRYNSDAKNLGEYLVQSGTYPGYIYSGRQWDHLVGFHLNTEIVPNLVQDLLVTTEMLHRPYFDISFTYIAAIKAKDLLTFGAGIMFDRAITPVPDLTNWSYLEGSTEYTKRGIKVMTRLAFDVKQLFGASSLFGNEDLKLYGEAAIIGIKDYPKYYEDITERVPVMIGFNLPLFGIVDYCSIEGEYYGSPHNNNAAEDGRYDPVPSEADVGDVDDIKWSVSTRKSFGDHFRIEARVANDHLRFEQANGGIEPWERTVEPSHWYWSLSTAFSF